jgi:putative transposase
MDGRLTKEILTSALPDSLIETYAEALGVVERQRKVDVVVLIWTLILGFPAGATRTLTSLKRRFEQVANIEISRASFYDRLTPAVASLLRRLVDWMLEVRCAQTAREIDEQLEGFKELLAVDSTVLNLHDLLAPTWEATNEGQAAAKMHVIANATTGGPNSVKLTDQRTHDSQPLKTVGQWVDGCLLMRANTSKRSSTGLSVRPWMSSWLWMSNCGSTVGALAPRRVCSVWSAENTLRPESITSTLRMSLPRY